MLCTGNSGKNCFAEEESPQKILGDSGSGAQQVQPKDGITKAEFAAPHPDLRPYVTAYYIAEVKSPDGQMMQDLLHPEWGSVRYVCGGAVEASAQPDPLQPVPPVVLVGHSARATRVACTSMRIVSFGLLPLGWHHFVGRPAHLYADRSVVADEAKSRVDFSLLFPAVVAAKTLDDVAAIFDNALMQAMLKRPIADMREDAVIQKLHFALMDPDVASVGQISERLGFSGSQLERLSKRVFGFAPKVLIRRQRFLRTLALLMRYPSSKWAEILDPQYYDQAHFYRDFQRFFGMSPSQYMAMDKPIAKVAAMARMKALGDPLQGLHAPCASF